MLVPLMLAALVLPGCGGSAREPGSIAGLGDSITRAANACCGGGDHPERSWSTGDGAADGVQSLYERLAERHPRMAENNFNFAVSGAEAADLPGQASEAVAAKADYITVLIGANDLCAASAAAMTSTADFARHIDAALGALDEGLPQSRVFLGSIPDLYQLWSALHTDPKARRAWQAAGTCRSMLDPGNTEAQRGQVVDRQQAFNRILAQTCARYANCRWDGGAISGYRFSAADISTLDYFHPGVRGQAVLADLAWRAFEP